MDAFLGAILKQFSVPDPASPMHGVLTTVVFRERLCRDFVEGKKDELAKRSFVKSFVSHLDGDELHFHP